MNKLLVICVFLMSVVQFSGGYKLLVVFPFPGRSHSILGEGYVRRLLLDGHEVTYITPLPIKNPPQNLRQVDVSSLTALQQDQYMKIENIINKDVDLKDIRMIFQLMYTFSNGTVLHENVQKLVQDESEEFDAVIVEWLFSELTAGFSAAFNCPLIWSSSMDPHWLVLQLIDEVPNSAYTGDLIIEAVVPFTFLERVEQLWMQIRTSYFRKIYLEPLEEQVYVEAFSKAVAKKGRTLPPFAEVKFNASLMLGNSHVSTGEAVRVPQNYKPIGGYHIPRNIEPLPDDLQKIMDNAKHGVIYFSMGSMLKGILPEKLKTDFLKLFGTLKQEVLWKLEESVQDLPENVHILNWAPQRSILAHPNMKIFITHGGLLSTTEAVHFGVPLIGVPGFADQHLNIQRAVAKGFARRVELNYEVVEGVKEAIEDVLDNPRYLQRVKELSFAYHDRPVFPGDELAHWVRHVIETRGAPHLRSPALLVPWYQKMYLDLAAMILVILLIIYIALRKVLENLIKKKKQTKLD